jgi:hypothetical protein
LKTRKVNAQRGAAKALDFGVSLTASADKKKQKGTAATSYKTIALKLTFMCNFPRTILDEKLRALSGHQSKKEPFLKDSTAPI